jgi:signal recognition particle GTPase
VNRLLKQFKEMRKTMKQMRKLAPRLAASGGGLDGLLG